MFLLWRTQTLSQAKNDRYLKTIQNLDFVTSEKKKTQKKTTKHKKWWPSFFLR